ncbi:MAG: hypothetical protein FWE09_07370 [Treponema sp.]|nr:hypothetical protein [Treponema sp.]
MENNKSRPQAAETAAIQSKKITPKSLLSPATRSLMGGAAAGAIMKGLTIIGGAGIALGGASTLVSCKEVYDPLIQTKGGVEFYADENVRASVETALNKLTDDDIRSATNGLVASWHGGSKAMVIETKNGLAIIKNGNIDNIIGDLEAGYNMAKPQYISLVDTRFGIEFHAEKGTDRDAVFEEIQGLPDLTGMDTAIASWKRTLIGGLTFTLANDGRIIIMSDGTQSTTGLLGDLGNGVAVWQNSKTLNIGRASR